MRGLSLTVSVHVSGRAVIRHKVFRECLGGSFVAVQVEDDTNPNTGVSLLITDPDVLANLAETAQAARAELIAAKTDQPATQPVPVTN